MGRVILWDDLAPATIAGGTRAAVLDAALALEDALSARRALLRKA